jgi:hypothetical protein
MAIFFKEGEIKKRPGVYQRHTNTGFSKPASANDGICAIPIQAAWGPLGKVLKNVSEADLRNNYGTGTYGTGFTVPAASAMFDGGASTVYTYRLGTGGTAASLKLVEGAEGATGLTVTAKYVGTMPISVAVQKKLGAADKKQFLVYVGSTQVEIWEFAADTKAEGANLIAATAKSKYITVTGAAAVVAELAVASGALTGGVNPTVTNEDYSKAFAALEPFYYNTIALDVDDDDDMTLSLLLQEYLDAAYLLGKLGMAVVGEPTTVDFEDRLAHAQAFNDAKVVYLGSGYMTGNNAKDGVMAICYTAGVIASTPSNQGITHKIIDGATDLCESRTFAEYEAAIASGMLMISMSTDGNVWYDSGVNTLTTPETGTQDEGWKKIRRTKTRFEMIDRIDRVLNPKVGRVSADTDGIADIIQTAQSVLNAMVTEGKLLAGATFMEDPANPHEGDSAWFVIQSDDIDSLEMIYLQYQFRYSQNS